MSLARELGMTLGELSRRMSSHELTVQQAYDAVLADEAKHEAAAQEAKQTVRKL